MPRSYATEFPDFTSADIPTVDDCEQFPTDTSVDCDTIAQVWVAIAGFASTEGR
jgi:hypothetical protein